MSTNEPIDPTANNEEFFDASNPPAIPQAECEMDLKPTPPWKMQLRRCAKYLWACNPFFLLSAALLLLGINRLAVDPDFLTGEIPKLFFNFSALEVYEALLVTVAIVLARRGIHYDAALLVIIESMLVMVPFILVTYAAMIERTLTMTIGGIGVGMAIARYGVLKYCNRSLHLPTGLLAGGIVLLLVNATIPFYFRAVIENGTDRWQVQYYWGWYLVLPVCVAAANLLPRPKAWRRSALERSWLPLLVWGLWASASAVHFYCIGYIGEMPFEFSVVIPTIWAAAWTFRGRLTDFAEYPSVILQRLSFVIPAFLPFCLVQDLSLFRLLVAGNLVIYSVYFLLRRRNELILQLILASGLFLVGAFPLEQLNNAGAGLQRRQLITIACVCYVVLLSLKTSRLSLMIAGMVVSGVGIASLGGVTLWNLGTQVGLLYLLIRSSFWKDSAIAGAGTVRALTAIGWVVHSAAWTHASGATADSTVIAGAIAVLTAYVAVRIWQRRWSSWIIPTSAAAASLTVPAHYFLERAKTTPSGLIPLVGSFVLLALGTFVALHRHRHHQEKPVVVSEE